MKRKYILVICCLISATFITAQNTTKTFVFDTYTQSINIENIHEYSSHELGDIIARKMQVIENTFLVRYDTKIGLTSSEIEIQKPDILESVEKIDKYYRKAVKKGIIDRELATQKLSNYLDIAYTLFYEDSIEFEKALGKAKKAEDIITLYDSIQMIDNKITANK